MQYSITFAAALAATVSAIPHPRSPNFQISQVANPNYVRNPIKEYQKALAKYSSRTSSSKLGEVLVAGKAPSGNDNGNVTTTPDDGGTGDGADSEYLTPVSINGNTYKLDFDTGSADLWVFGSKVGGSHTVFTPKSGDTAISGETWSIAYGDGSSAKGNVYSESVTVGGVTVTSQAVEVATSASKEFATGTPDGLLGLAFSSINTVKKSGRSSPANTFFQNAINQGVLSQPVVGVELKYKAPGSYDFGNVRSDLDITYTDVDSSEGFWTFTPDSFLVGGQPADASSSLTGIADTGTTLMLLPDDVVTAYYQGTGAKFNSQDQVYEFPCSTKLPDFGLVVGGTTFTVPGLYLNYDVAAEGSKTCIGGIQPGGDNVIYGDIFLKSVYAVFDATEGSPRLGFAQNV